MITRRNILIEHSIEEEDFSDALVVIYSEGDPALNKLIVVHLAASGWVQYNMIKLCQ